MPAIQFVILKWLAAVDNTEVVDELHVAWLAVDGDRVLECNEVDCIEGFRLSGGEWRDVSGAGSHDGAR